MQRFMHWMGNNAIQIPSERAEEKVRGELPKLLDADEHLEMAFKMEYNHFYFTTCRILFKTKMSLGGHKVEYKSIPYETVTGFSVLTSSKHFWDLDTKLTVWSKGWGKITMDFQRGEVDIFAVNAYMNTKLLPHVAARPPPPAGKPQPDEGQAEAFLNWLADDASELDPATVEQRLKASPPVLEPDESVQLAYKCGRDSLVFTTKRILNVDVRGLSGDQVAYTSLLYGCLRAYAVTTAGGFLDRDAEVSIWTNHEEPQLRKFKVDMRKGRADIMALQRFLTDTLLGTDTVAASAHAAAGGAEVGGSTAAWFGDDQRQVDKAAVDAKFHSDPPLLQGNEQVEMAFRGRRDMTIFTTKRLIIVDVQGFSGKRTSYISVPWKIVQAFSVCTAGGMFDKDSELRIWTDIMHDYRQTDNGPEPIPEMSFIEQDFQKNAVDIMLMHRYLSQRCVPTRASAGRAEPVPTAALQAAPAAGGTESLFNWLGQDASEIDPRGFEEQLRGAAMLRADETVCMAFKVGRDTLCFTSCRVIVVDVQGWSGKSVEYMSLPFASIHAFAVESAGGWDRDSELKLYTKNKWTTCVLTQDLRKGRADIIAINKFLGQQILGAGGEGAPVVAHGGAADAAASIDGFLGWIGADAEQIDAAAAQERLSSQPPILLGDETVEYALKLGRDLLVFTTKRLLLVDVQGWSGKKVAYLSVPLEGLEGFSVESAGSLDTDAHAVVHTNVPGLKGIQQDLRKGRVDIFEVQAVFIRKLLQRQRAHHASLGYTPEAGAPDGGRSWRQWFRR